MSAFTLFVCLTGYGDLKGPLCYNCPQLTPYGRCHDVTFCPEGEVMFAMNIFTIFIKTRGLVLSIIMVQSIITLLYQHIKTRGLFVSIIRVQSVITLLYQHIKNTWMIFVSIITVQSVITLLYQHMN